jgi:hypothetical protein
VNVYPFIEAEQQNAPAETPTSPEPVSCSGSPRSAYYVQDQQMSAEVDSDAISGRPLVVSPQEFVDGQVLQGRPIARE